MSALEMGLKRGQQYLQRHSLETLATITLQQFCAIGRVDARQKYKQKKAQDDYARGWFETGNKFLSLFKPADEEQFVAEKELDLIGMHLKAAQKSLLKLQQWRQDNIVLQQYIDNAYEDINEARLTITNLTHQIKRG